jgi:hypothetical protein
MSDQIRFLKEIVKGNTNYFKFYGEKKVWVDDGTARALIYLYGHLKNKESKIEFLDILSKRNRFINFLNKNKHNLYFSLHSL